MEWIICNWQILWITLVYILQSALYVSVYLCVTHLLQSAAPLRVIFWFLLSKRVKEKQLRWQKWNCCQAAALNETWRLPQFFEAACVKLVMNQIFIFRIRILSADTGHVTSVSNARMPCTISISMSEILLSLTRIPSNYSQVHHLLLRTSCFCFSNHFVSFVRCSAMW